MGAYSLCEKALVRPAQLDEGLFSSSLVLLSTMFVRMQLQALAPICLHPACASDKR